MWRFAFHPHYCCGAMEKQEAVIAVARAAYQYGKETRIDWNRTADDYTK